MKNTLALACILKNEINNIDQLLKSVSGCFDEIHFTDTGSEDGSIELLEKYSKGPNPAGTEIHLHHFKWVNDFAAARNASFNPIKTKYTMWLDLDDVLSSKEAFLEWRESILDIADFWMATYHYASNKEGKPICSFARERVFNNDFGLKWKYFVHEGIVPAPNMRVNYAVNWQVVHMRGEEDVKKDRKRNLSMFKDRELDARMTYYYGKEQFENLEYLEAFGNLKKAASDILLEGHDRIMAIQYACICAMHLNQFETAIQLAHQGLQLCPGRAEFFVVIADCYVKSNKVAEAIPYYRAATNCAYNFNSKIQGAIYTNKDSYTTYPYLQLARVYANMGAIDLASEAADDALRVGPNEEALGVKGDIEKLKNMASVGVTVGKRKTDDIVISCHPNGFYEWDEEVYANRGIGGSETGAVEIAKWLSLKTGRDVIVFNNRDSQKSFEKRHYRPTKELPAYFQENTPRVNIAWRHNIKLTEAPTYLWSHDLACPDIDKTSHYEKIIALSEFHKSYIHNLFGVPREKIWVSKNGIEPNRFTEKYEKDQTKIIYSSSPDRGLDRTLLVMDKVVKACPEVKLHCFYGFNNMEMLGMKHEAERLQKMINERPYVVYHGNVTQKELTRHMGEAVVWLYPTNFLETFCITALEALCSETYPIVRHYGGLKNTLSNAQKSGMCDMLDMDCLSESEIERYALAVVDALHDKKWSKVKVDPHDYSWERVADEWIQYMGL
jgi:glycosyltransferase involved in cell wall biosynthesis